MVAMNNESRANLQRQLLEQTPEDHFYRMCALHTRKLECRLRGIFQLQITHLILNAEEPDHPPRSIPPLPKLPQQQHQRHQQRSSHPTTPRHHLMHQPQSQPSLSLQEQFYEQDRDRSIDQAYDNAYLTGSLVCESLDLI